MPNLDAQPGWVPVREIGIELARGGPDGNMNEQAKALLARTEYLKQEKANKSEIVQGVYEFGTYAEFIGYFLIFLVFVIAFFQNCFGGVG